MNKPLYFEKIPAPVSQEDIEWEKVVDQIKHIQGSARRPEDMLPAFALQRAWLKKHPEDMSMRRFGSALIRSVERMGGSWEEFQKLLPSVEPEKARPQKIAA